MDVVERITQYRLENYISQEKMSKLLGLSQNMVGRYERKEARPSALVRAKVTRRLDELEKGE